MNAVINFLIHLLMAVFVIGGAGCTVLIPVVAFKFVSVLFEVDPAPYADAIQE